MDRSKSSSRYITKSVLVPEHGVGMIIGTKGRNIKRLQSMEGILSVQVVEGFVEVIGTSTTAVDAVLDDVENYYPKVDILLFQPTDPRLYRSIHLVPVGSGHSKLLWEAVDGPSSFRHSSSCGNPATLPKFVGYHGVVKKDYAEQLLELFGSIRSCTPKESRLKLAVRIGKVIFNSRQPVIRVPVQQMAKVRHKFNFLLHSADVAPIIRELESNGYHKLRGRFQKVKLHFTGNDGTGHVVSTKPTKSQLEEALPTELFCGVLGDDGDDSDEDDGPDDVEPRKRWSFSGKAKKHGLITNVREGRYADLRLLVATCEQDQCPDEDLLHASEHIWNAKKSGKPFRFNAEDPFRVSVVRFKETCKFLHRDTLIKVSKVAMHDHGGPGFVRKCHWEVTIKSLWLKKHLDSVKKLELVV